MRRLDAKNVEMNFAMTPIGVVRNERTEPVDDDWDRVNSSIELDLSLLGEEATKGLFRFSHVEVVFVFDRVDPESVELAARHPRGNTDWPKVGILAQRAKARPNRIGTTVCELMAVRPGGVIEVRGLGRDRRHARARHQAVSRRVRAAR